MRITARLFGLLLLLLGGTVTLNVIVAFAEGIVTMPVGPPSPVTITVTSAADGGPGTLRRALFNANPGDIITFDPKVFPPNIPTTITLTRQLPDLTQGNLTIDASNAGVILDGSEITDPGFHYGINILSNSNTIRGLQIVGFAEAGIALEGGASDNLIGGDRGIGSGPLGQGNLISGNGNFGIVMYDTSHNTIQGNYVGINLDGTETWGHTRDGINFNGAYNVITDNVIGGSNRSGINLCCVADGHNTVTANFIGTDANGEIRLRNRYGILIDQTGYNVIGPGNIIAFNRLAGVTFWDDTPYNTVTQNSIHDNRGLAIEVFSASDARKARPLLLDFDLQAGSLTGLACANCSVEIFSDNDDEGRTYEGQTEADGIGFFTFSKEVAFAGPHLTANATDPNGSTTEYSRATQGDSGFLSIQEDNTLAKQLLQSKQSSELVDNRIGSNPGPLGPLNDGTKEDLLEKLTALGVKRIVAIFYEGEPPIDWSLGSEFIIPETADRFIDDLGEQGIAVNFSLHFWDKDGHARGEELSTPRFQTEEQVQDFLDYVRFMVRHLKGRVQYYTIWSEPGACGDGGLKCIEPVDYINLARQTIPVIREEDPQAKVVLAPVVLYFGRDLLFTVLDSDVVQLFDVIDWHPFYDAAPDIEFFGNYYYDYPSIIGEIKQRASANGFQGEYWGTDLSWGSRDPTEGQPWPGHTEIQNAKYYARVTVLQLGLDVGVGVESVHDQFFMKYETMRNLNTVMAGASPESLAVEIESEATNIVSYGFTLPNGDTLFALWTDGAAVDIDPGVRTTLTFPGLSASKVMGIDVLNGFEQELVGETGNGNLVIRNLLVKDYPIILRLITAFASVVPATLEINGSVEALVNTFVGVAIVNPNDSPNEISLSLVDSSGIELTKIELEEPLAPQGQTTFLTSEIVESVQNPLSIIIRGKQGRVQSFFMIQDTSLRKLDGVGGEFKDSGQLYFPIIRQGSEADTVLFVFNPHIEDSSEVAFQLFNQSGELIQEASLAISSNGFMMRTLKDLFEGLGVVQNGYVRVTSDVSLMGFEFLAEPDHFSALAAQTVEIGERLFVPHFFVDKQGGTTEIRLVNTETGTGVQVTLKAFDDSSNLLAMTQFEVAAGSLFVGDIQELLDLGSDAQSGDETITGYLELEATSFLGTFPVTPQLVGAMTFTGNGGKFRSTLPMVKTGRTESSLLYVAQSQEAEIFTGLAILNTTSDTATVAIRAFDAQGNQTGEIELELSARSRVVDLLNGDKFFGAAFDQLGGHLQVSSSVRVISFALFGDFKSEFLSAIAGQTGLR